MISISSIYIICFLPSGIITILQSLLNDPKFGSIALQVCFQYTYLFANALLPFVTLSLLPDLRIKIKQIFKRLIPTSIQTRPVRVRPMITFIPNIGQ